MGMVSKKIRDGLIKRAQDFHLGLDDISITHLSFSNEFARAIEHKQIAQQDAERQSYVVARSEQEKLATIIEAEGDAQGAKLISEALQHSGRGLIEVRRIDAAQEIAEKLARNRNVTYVPGGQGMLLNLGK